MLKLLWLVVVSLSVLHAQTPVLIRQNSNTATVSASGALKVDGSAVTQPVSGTVAATQSGTWTVQPGNTANTTPWLISVSQGGNTATVSAGGALKVDGSAVTQPVSGTVNAAQSGTWTVQPGNTANTTPWLISISQGGNTATVSAAGALKVDGSAVTQPISGTVSATQSGTWSVRAQDGSGNALASSTSAPAGTEQALIVRNIPSGTQTVSGTVTANAGTGSFTVAQATAANLNAAVVGTKTNNNAAPSSTNIGAFPAIANAAVQTWTEGNLVALSTDLSGNLRIIQAATAVTTGSASGCYLVSAASTNSTNCKNAAGNVYGYRFVNTTATIYYLRMYNSSSAPTCSSATGFIESIPIPANTSGAGIVAMSTIPIGYTTGIGFCFTGGSSSTDNTNAATGVFGAIYYK